ncbi:MAG: AraC family transcriptional regulator [Planctomycetota bacterium]|jgi:AraC-like DNA-binding protein|nr:AraC family transcriptional regulator [Planctomycetota bacterium]
MTYFSDIQFETGGLQPRYRLHLDRQPETYSIELCSAGAMYHQRSELGTEHFAGNALFWHHPHERYRYGPSENPGWWYHHFVLFRGERAARLFAQALDPLSATHAISIPDPAPFHRLFRNLIGLIGGAQPQQARAVAMLERIVAELVTAITAPPPTGISAAVADLAQRMAINPFRDWQWSAEAHSLGLSLAHFRRLYRDTLGAPPQRHLLQLQMRAVGTLLLSDSRPVYQIAEELGFTDQATLTRRFARVHGQSPRRWRAIHAPGL